MLPGVEGAPGLLVVGAVEPPVDAAGAGRAMAFP